MRDLQGRVPDFAGLLTEDGSQEPLLRSKLGLALGRDLADEDVTGHHVGSDADYASVVQILECILTYVGDVSGDLFRSELGVAALKFVLLYVDAGEGIFLDQFFIDEDSVLVVVALPCGESDEHVLAQGDLSVGCGGSVSNDITRFHSVAFVDDGSLVDTGGLVGAQELYEFVCALIAVVLSDDDLAGADAHHGSGRRCEHDHSGVMGCLVFHACSDIRLLSDKERDRLALHIRSHQSAVAVVVLKERDHRRGG